MITMCSLQITPACNLPLKALRGGGKIVIVNLQVFDLLFQANIRLALYFCFAQTTPYFKGGLCNFPYYYLYLVR